MLKNLSVCKFTVLVCLLWMPAMKATAQFSAGITAGFTLSQPDKAPGVIYSEYLPAGGFAAGFSFQYNLDARLAIYAEPGVFQKNISYRRTKNYSATWEKNSNTYLQLPVMLQYRYPLGKKLDAFAQAGAYAGWWAFKSKKGAIPNIYDLTDGTAPDGTPSSYFRMAEYSENNAFESKKDQRFDFGAVGGIGANWLYKDGYRLSVEIRYSYSLNSYQKEYMENQQLHSHRTAAVMIGWMKDL
ncbi:PorT family protein [Pseudoflavitalea sp. G-6-1-2]|uniref:porin family protein n=1 Tax=Pseudoflavitalea sp. G-6-1-2 TaxID=2728841 RepID=UPI00146E6F2D|nr:porin family protein [Pseudoflavitalea sp. G-6-1-2]NML21628.1 PorT family protein [Pseudoflavitalea sp. G-6-1-2]